MISDSGFAWFCLVHPCTNPLLRIRCQGLNEYGRVECWQRQYLIESLEMLDILVLA